MNFLVFYGLWIGVLVALLGANKVLGDSIIEEFGKQGSEKFRFNMIREVNMFLEEILYFLDQAEWITEEDTDYMLKLLNHYRKKIWYQIEDKSLELQITKETLEENEYRKILNEYKIVAVNEKKIDIKDEKNKGINENKKLYKNEKHEIESKDEESIGEEDRKELDKRELRGNSSKEEDTGEIRLEKDKNGKKLSERNGNRNIPKQVKYEEFTRRKQYRDLSPIDEKLNETDMGDEGEITEYKYDLEMPERYDDKLEPLDVLPVREVNRMKDKMESIQQEIYTLKDRMEELIRIQRIVRSLKDQIEEHLRIQQESESHEHFQELEGETTSINEE